MTAGIQHIDLFTSQGCLSLSALKKGMRGELSVEQKEKVNTHLRTCELCRKALEGTGYFDDAGDFDRGIKELRNKWSHKHTTGKHFIRPMNIGLVSVAATVLLLIGISLFYFVKKQITPDYYADILKHGIMIDSALAQVQIHPFAGDQQHMKWIERDQETRNTFVSDSNNRISTVPIGRIDNTKVYAQALAPETSKSKILSAGNQNFRKSHLRYPYVVMSKPPTYLNLEMPAEEYERDELFVIVEEMPAFRGSDLYSFKDYIQRKIKYPQEAIEKHISGRVYARFTINRSGELVDAGIIKSVHPVLDREVLRVLNDSPLWQAGRQRDKPVHVSMIMPVDFYLYEY